MRRSSSFALIVVLLVSALPLVALRAQESDEGFEARLLRARGLATSGDSAKRLHAIALYDSMLVASPGNSDVLLARGRTYAWSGRYSEAEADLRAVTEAKPGYADAWSALGDLYKWSDRPRLAAEAYGRWGALVPDAFEPLIARGRALRDAGEMAAAREDFASAELRGADPALVSTLEQSTRPGQAAVEALQSEDYRWLLRAGQDVTAFTGGRDTWTDAAVSIRRSFDRGSLALEWLQANHFRQRQQAWALDGFARLWDRAYVNVRYQQGPREAPVALPRAAQRVELFQGVGRGWELSASIDRLQFATVTQFHGIGLGRYVGNWYLRYRVLPGGGSGNWSQRMVVRNYYRGNADDFIGFNFGNGQIADLDRVGVPIRSTGVGAGVNWVRYLRNDWGFRVAAGYDEFGGFVERLLSLSLYRRW